ncbi:MAG: hypothetical protein K2G96_05370, partial [Clostridia bacterium]|nr:hypothetical protein [Clostridia bacterium]
SEGRDMGYVMGPPAAMEGVAKYILWLTPKAWKDPYLPILWELFPVIILGGLYTLIASLYWEHAHIKEDVIKVKNAVVGFFTRSKSKNKKLENAEAENRAADEEEPLKFNK